MIYKSFSSCIQLNTLWRQDISCSDLWTWLLLLVEYSILSFPISENGCPLAQCVATSTKCKLKLDHAKRNPYFKSTQKCRLLLWAWVHLNRADAKWKSMLWSDESTFPIGFGHYGRWVIQAKEEKNHLDWHGKFKSHPVWWNGGVLVSLAWLTCTSWRQH